MPNHKGIRATANLKMLEVVAKKLEKLNDEVVYLGGCTTALFVTDPLSLDVRPTLDVDCIVDIATLNEYYQFGKKLKKCGFKESSEDGIICRWRCDEIILDVVPTDEKILNFANRWGKEAIQNAIVHELAKDLLIKSVSAPYLLATKIDAFHDRGNHDFFGSHDFEDIITVIAGRIEIADEVINLKNDDLRLHLKDFFRVIINNVEFQQALPGHVNDGPVTLQRVQVVLDRIRELII